MIDPYSIAGRTAHTGLSNDLRLDFILIFYDLIFPFGNVYKVCDSVNIFINIYWWGKVMKRSLIYTAVFSAMLVMTGCGGGDGNDHQNAEQNEKPSNTPLTPQQKENILTVSEHSHHIAARESLALGMVDTAIYGIDGIVEDDEQCTSGTYTNIKGVINFNQCDGLFYKFEAGQYQSLIAKSGTVTVKNGEYSYQNLVLENPETKETQTITGSLKSDVNDTSATLATNNLIVNASEKTQNSFYNVKYVFENYKLNYKLKSDTELNITTNGTLSVVNSPVGDYKIKFETPTPLALRVSEDDEDSFPHQGVIKVEDINNKATTTLSVIPNTNNVQYRVMSGNEKLADRVEKWEEVFSYKSQQNNTVLQNATTNDVSGVKSDITGANPDKTSSQTVNKPTVNSANVATCTYNSTTSSTNKVRAFSANQIGNLPQCSSSSSASSSGSISNGSGNNNSDDKKIEACGKKPYTGDSSDPQVYTFDYIAQIAQCSYRATGNTYYSSYGDTQCQVLDGLLSSIKHNFRPQYCSGSKMIR